MDKQYPHPMARRGVSIDRQHELAVQAARRLIAQGDRPGYRLRPVQDGSWQVEGLPGLSMPAMAARDALDAARDAIADLLGVGPDSFDVEQSARIRTASAARQRSCDGGH